MSQSPAAQITIDQLRNREIVATDLLRSAAANPAAEPGRRSDVITAPSEPMSVFGRKMTGHDA